MLSREAAGYFIILAGFVRKSPPLPYSSGLLLCHVASKNVAILVTRPIKSMHTLGAV